MFPMPVSMENIDSDHHLIPGDKIIIDIVEDREPRKLLFVDEKGTIKVPWIEKSIPVEDLTLRDVAEHLRAALQFDKDGNKLNFYQDGHPIVLATYFYNDRSRGRAVVEGEVQKPDNVSIPMDGILTLSDAIRDAGGFNSGADREHIGILHHDPMDPTKTTKETVNMTDLMAKVAGKAVLPGDIITVPSKTETGAYYHIGGKGALHGGKFPLQAGGPTTVAEAVQLAGFDNFSKLSAVRLLRDVKDPKTGQTKTETIIVDVEDVLNNGNKTKDVPLQNGDYIIVEQKWIAW